MRYAMGDDYTFQPHSEKANAVDEGDKRTSRHQPPPPSITTTFSGTEAHRSYVAKVAEVTAAALQHPADLPRLAVLATSPGGLVTDELRRAICTSRH